MFAFISGIWAFATLFVFFKAIRLSYAIEAKAGVVGKRNLPRRTNLFASAYGSRAGDDEETVAMRMRLRRLLPIVATGFLAFGVLAFYLAPPGLDRAR